MLEIKEITRQVLFPQKCRCCFKLADKDNLCNSCMAKLIRCKIPSDKQLLKLRPELVDRTYSSYYYTGMGRQAVLNAKYKNPASFLNSFTKDIYYDIDSILSENQIDLIVPSPAYKTKFYSQEYDLPMEMAKKISKEFNIPVSYCIKKIRKTEKQHDLSKEKRKVNLVNAFEVVEDIRDKNILLIDDVLTTGVTVSTIAKELKIAGCKQVIAWAYTYNTFERKDKNG